ncbi:hypothetical protein ACSFA8_22575 [Variovorax sp. RT4R15]|uniref:hypothetical protein n=1 Tax=Variovorax sp. RT4R15 TaxID=3443737 RepID=UPI003F478AB7
MSIAGKLSSTPPTLLTWGRQHERDTGAQREGLIQVVERAQRNADLGRAGDPASRSMALTRSRVSSRMEVRVARRIGGRLMQRQGLRGVARGKAVQTTIDYARGTCPPTVVSQQFGTQRPNQPWISDFTHIVSWQRWQYVAFVIDVFARRSAGWWLRTLMGTDIVHDPLEKALNACPPERHDALFVTRIEAHVGRTEAGIEPVVRSKSGSSDNAFLRFLVAFTRIVMAVGDQGVDGTGHARMGVLVQRPMLQR